MKTHSNHFIFILIVFIALVFTACESIFEYTPYTAKVPDKLKNTTLLNIQIARQNSLVDKEVIKIAVISDLHNYYSQLDNVIEQINHDYEIDLVIIPGDLTDVGLLKEYEFIHNSLENLVMPYFTVIGNHDYRSNGESIYNQMFGENNYTLEFKNLKFVFFDGIIWESNLLPDFTWLNEELSTQDNMKHILVTHIPPSTSEYPEYRENGYLEIIENSGTDLVINGHDHNFSINEHNNITYLTCGSINRNYYSVITLQNDGFNIEKKNF